MNQDGSLIVNKKKKLILNNIMRNYSFGYLVEKVQTLNEMSLKGKSKTWTQLPEFYDIIQQTHEVMKPEVKKLDPDADVSHKRIPYMGRMLMKFLKMPGVYSELFKKATFEEIPKEERTDKKSVRPTQEYLEFNPKGVNSDPPRQNYFLFKLVEDNYEAATSDKFRKFVTDLKNIDEYLAGNKKKGQTSAMDTAATSNYASGMRKKQESLLGMSQEEYAQLQNDANALLKKLRKSKKLPKGLFQSIYRAPSVNELVISNEKGDETLNTGMIPLLATQLALEILLDERKKIAVLVKYREELSEDQDGLYNFDISIIQKTLDVVSKRIEEGKPTSLDTLKNKIFPLFDDIKETFIEEFDLAYEQLLQGSQAGNIASVMKKQEYSNIFDMLDDDLLKSLEKEGLIDSKDRETLKKWANAAGTKKQGVKTKGEKILIKNIEKGKQQDEYDKKKQEWDEKAAKRKAQKEGNREVYKDKLEELKDMKIEEIENEIYDAYTSDNPDFDLIEYMEKYLERRKTRQNKKISVYENCVMDYFTEQVQKDNLLNQKGEYKERGFKKPKNYAHWLWLNDQ